MPRLLRPSQREIDARLAAPELPFTYWETGATARVGGSFPAALSSAYDLDRHVFPIGVGRDCFERARNAMLSWRHFDIPWLTLHGAASPATTGQVVATLVRIGGLWFLNPCRVVYTDATDDSASFAYGTLPGHQERGEERFRIAHDARTGEVSFEIVAFSRPATALARLGYPLARSIQRRFVGAAASALRCAVNEGRDGGSSAAGSP